MAELTDHPRGRASGSDTSAAAQDYSSLSLLAVAGFVVGCLWALGMAAGVFVAVFSSKPLLLPAWAFVIPVVGALLSGAGWVQINRSEGLKAGASLARWGLTLSVLVGLGYGAYAAATHLAVRQKASAFTDDWLDKMKNGRVHSAFRLTLPPDVRPDENPSDPDESKLRTLLEVRFNIGEDIGKGPLSHFSQGDLVRYFRAARRNVEIKPLGVRNLKYARGGYLVSQDYRVTTPQAVFEMVVTVQSVENASATTPGSQWYVVLNETGLSGAPVRLTSHGQEMAQAGAASRTFLDEWLQKLNQGKFEEAFLDTCAPAARNRLRADYHERSISNAVAAVGGLLALTDANEARLYFLPGYREFAAGSLVTHKDSQFWCSAKDPIPVINEVKRLFQDGGLSFPARLRMDPVVPVAIGDEEGSRLRSEHALTLNFLPFAVVEATLVVEDASDPATPHSEPVWQIKSLDLLRARVAAP